MMGLKAHHKLKKLVICLIYIYPFGSAVVRHPCFGILVLIEVMEFTLNTARFYITSYPDALDNNLADTMLPHITQNPLEAVSRLLHGFADFRPNKFTVVLVGGEYYNEDDCFGGNITEEFLKRFHVNKSFVFPSALSVKNGIEGYVLPTISISRLLTEIADKVFVLADSEKFSTRAMYKIMDLDPEFIYITDSQVKNKIKTEFAEKGFVLISEEQ